MADDKELPRLNQIISYVQSKGWEKQSAAACSKVCIYSDDQDNSLTLPKSDKFIDSEFQMRKALELLSTVEGVSKDALVKMIQSL